MGHIEHNRRYFTYIRRTMKELLTSSQDVTHPFLLTRPRQHRTYVVIAGDKGLCGSHNSTVLNFALGHVKADPGCGLITLGHTAEAFFHTRGVLDMRARVEGDGVRLEVLAGDMARVAGEWREDVLAAVRAAGFRRVTLDLAPRKQ